jgi:hypothetical protein
MVFIRTRHCDDGRSYAKIVLERGKNTSENGYDVYFDKAVNLRTWVDNNIYANPHTKSRIIADLRACQEVDISSFC